MQSSVLTLPGLPGCLAAALANRSTPCMLLRCAGMVVRRASHVFRAADLPPLQRMRAAQMLAGAAVGSGSSVIALTGCSWGCLGGECIVLCM